MRTFYLKDVSDRSGPIYQLCVVERPAPKFPQVLDILDWKDIDWLIANGDRVILEPRDKRLQPALEILREEKLIYTTEAA